MGDINYAFTNFSEAVDLMATHPGNIKDRLVAANNQFAPVLEKDLPEELKADYKWIMEKLTKKEPVFDEGSVRATLFGMHTKTAVKIAKKIVFFEK